MYIIDFGKSLFRKANIGVIIYLVMNMSLFIGLFGGFSSGGMAAFGIILYLISLCIALSPVGEFILRLQMGCRKIKRTEYLERLMPLFDEVYAQAKAKNPAISDKVRLFMSGNKSPDAFATGRKTICISKGFLGYTDEQIKGTLAHEFAHLSNKDTDLLLVVLVGNMIISVMLVIYRVIINLIVALFTDALNMGWLGTILTFFFVNLLLNAALWGWSKIGFLLCMHSSRENEYDADLFAFELGYGDDLCVVLDSLESSDPSEKRQIFAQLRSSHPAIDDRIARLQSYGANYRNAYGHDLYSINANPEQYGYAHNSPPPPEPYYPAQRGRAAFAPPPPPSRGRTARQPVGGDGNRPVPPPPPRRQPAPPPEYTPPPRRQPAPAPPPRRRETAPLPEYRDDYRQPAPPPPRGTSQAPSPTKPPPRRQPTPTIEYLDDYEQTAPPPRRQPAPPPRRQPTPTIEYLDDYEQTAPPPRRQPPPPVGDGLARPAPERSRPAPPPPRRQPASPQPAARPRFCSECGAKADKGRFCAECGEMI